MVITKIASPANYNIVASLHLPDTAVSPQNPDAQPIRTVLPDSDVANVALCRLFTLCEHTDKRHNFFAAKKAFQDERVKRWGIFQNVNKLDYACAWQSHDQTDHYHNKMEDG